jgi:NMD protein affecting ribosome stability and mRNA decay
VCRTCKVIFREGRWQRADHWPVDAHQVLCPACQRTRDNYPAGMVVLKGRFVPEHKDEMVALARHLEEEENRSHVLHRIMAMEDTPEGMIIKTTDLHLPRRIGEAVHRAFKGDLALRYEEDGCLLRVTWSRD